MPANFQRFGHMVSKNSEKVKTGHKKSRPKQQMRFIVGILGIATLLAIGGTILLSDHRNSAEKARSGGSVTDESARSAAPAEVRVVFQKLVGRWRRSDSGYILEISDIDPEGNLKAAYYNPRPINVSLAYAAQEDEYTRVYVELRDVGYPGATYSLTYHKELDAFAGLYHQPTAGQTFQVIFLREK